jgi:hypothetical protein
MLGANAVIVAPGPRGQTDPKAKPRPIISPALSPINNNAAALRV